jgi:hypothetical protein
MSSSLPADCEAFDTMVAEAALEILDSDERDAVLAHAATCDRCATELAQLSAAADRLTLLAPECEPPVGFEQRVMESLSSQPVTRLRPIRPVRLVHLAAAAIVLFVVGVAVGLIVHSRSTSVADQQSTRFRYSDLVGSDGVNHGSVSLVADRSSSPDVVLTMSLSNLDDGQYHCVVKLGDGSTTDVAAWPIDASGKGTWAVPIASGINEVHGVSVVDDDGSTVAMTNWP